MTMSCFPRGCIKFKSNLGERKFIELNLRMLIFDNIFSVKEYPNLIICLLFLVLGKWR